MIHKLGLLKIHGDRNGEWMDFFKSKNLEKKVALIRLKKLPILKFDKYYIIIIIKTPQIMEERNSSVKGLRDYY